MRRMQSPTPNRKGEYEIHDVPSRKVAGLLARGWTDIDASLPEADNTEKTAGPLTESLSPRPQLDLSGKWLSKRTEIRDLLGLESPPKSKDEARVLPVRRTTKGGKPAYQWGSGKKYAYTPGNRESRERAKRKAQAQGRAAHAR